ncbi:MAG TPA: succinyl-diaminopimelate desuccinylase [Steroidobacteraceae bacterium]|jgi:succinyl-diaminopimelate desuccinylase|nr:succinyl-diaminopimelate desuccinylase [Steroidobacteraceae bacterium]
MSPTLELAHELMMRRSVTPADEGCQEVMAARLAACGFQVERLRYGNVDNLWARRGGAGPVLCFAGHTDVVPTGPLEEWRSDPFKPEVREGRLFGRGAADMKTGLAAMITAVEAFVSEHPAHRGAMAFLITSDEEGPSVDGTKRVVETLRGRGERIDWCLVGEPSSEHEVGDTIKIGRRGSLSARLTVHGVQGHIAYPHLAENPVHTFAPALAELTTRTWDQGNEHFQPTSFQISNMNAGTGAPNVIPGELKARFNLRFSPVQTIDTLKQTVEDLLRRHKVRFSIEWYVSGEPFYTPPGPLSEAVTAAIRQRTGRSAKLSTGGGTSDGRFIAPMGAQVVEVGVVNASIHKVNESVLLSEVDALHEIYLQTLRNLLV